MAVKEKNAAAVALGKLGRAANTKAQKAASRKNGATGGRPPKHRCRKCGATGDGLYRAEGKYRCRKCGRKGKLENIVVVY